MSLRAQYRREAREDERNERYMNDVNEFVAAYHFTPRLMHGVCRRKGCGVRGWLALPAGTCYRRCTPKLHALAWLERFLGR